MKFELTISGLCILAMKSSEMKPKNPEQVDIIVPAAHHHKCRFVWNPDEVRPSVEPELVVDPGGRRYASLNLDRWALQIAFPGFEATDFTVYWGEDVQTPPTPDDQRWLNWVPRLEWLGFDPFEIPPDDQLPKGACARISLPFGTLSSRNMILNVDTNDPEDYALWQFKGGNKRALANEIVYTVDGVGSILVTDSQAGEVVRIDGGGDQTVRMCISNDMERVPTDYTADIDDLAHLAHLGVITTGSFVLPKKVPGANTGHKICDQIVYVYYGD